MLKVSILVTVFLYSPIFCMERNIPRKVDNSEREFNILQELSRVDYRDIWLKILEYTGVKQGIIKYLQENISIPAELVSKDDELRIKYYELEKRDPVDSTIVREKGHDGRVTAKCLISKDRLATGSDDKTIRIWSLPDYAEQAQWNAHDDVIICLTHHQNKLFSAAANGSIKIWNLENNTLISTLNGHTSKIKSLCHLDNNRLLSADTSAIKIWDLKTMHEIACTGHNLKIEYICKLPTNKAAIASKDTIHLWDLEKYKEVRTLSKGPALCSYLKMDPNNKLIVKGSLLCEFDTYYSLNNFLAIEKNVETVFEGINSDNRIRRMQVLIFLALNQQLTTEQRLLMPKGDAFRVLFNNLPQFMQVAFKQNKNS